MQAAPVKQDLVLIGGGHAHVEVLRRFGMRPEPGVRITLVSRDTHTPYSGMLPGLVAGHYGFDEVHIDLAPLTRFANARLYRDEVVGLDLVARRVLCRERPPIDFDVLSIDTGSAPAMAVPGAAAHAVPVKPVSNFNTRWQALCEEVMASTRPLTIGVVGAGAGGCELVLAVREGLRGRHPLGDDALAYRLVGSGADILPGHNAGARRRFRAALARAGIDVLDGFEVAAVDDRGVTAHDGRRLDLDTVLWVTHAAAPAWPAAAGLAVDERGFIRVDASLQAIAWPGIFAAGDVAAVGPHPRPKSGVFAVRQGPPLADNLRRACRGEAPRPFTPQREFLSLISTGARHAVASRGRFAAGGTWAWRWKDWIDRRFMRRYRELPQMDAAGAATDDDATEAMRCGGCGAKIGADILRDALATLDAAAREDVVLGIAEADDAAVVRIPAGHLAVHTVDGFRAFLDDPWMLGRVGAQHALNDVYAMGATPQSALALVTLPYAAPARLHGDLVHVLRGAIEVFAAADTALVGGHTGEGAELSLAFAVNGYVAPGQLVGKRGVRTGDVLVLTRALGTGVLFAAAMRGLARARWLEAALERMVQSNAAAARCLVAHGAHAMTDVTGFGLAGHLLEMLDGHAAEVALGRLPLYAGAETLAGDAVASTLLAENRRAERAVTARHSAACGARYDLAFDPQTAGGLLAAIPAERAVDCLGALRAAGYAEATDIGTVGAGAGPLVFSD
ncbi:MAG: selenide, water dikinase SelD [Gammaproteobacteria bacterium]|nr:selenide, water dikinase SelD [Gammaproteobacteria bacterium]